MGPTPHETTPNAPAPSQTTHQRDGAAMVGWALTALTCVVLLVGVAIIRHTSRDERPATRPLASDPPRTGPAIAPPAEAPAPIVLMPTPPIDDSASLPRPMATGIDLASGELAPGFAPAQPAVGGAEPSGGVPHTATPNPPAGYR